MPGEAIPKHVAILSVTGRDFKMENIRLKTVRPFVMKEIVLSEDKEAKKLAKKENNRSALTRRLQDIVNELISQANAEWQEAQDGTNEQESNPDEEENKPLLPLVRLRVEYSAPDGGNFDCENPQRFSNRFVNQVANVNDVVQFYRKKTGSSRKAQNGAELPEESILAQLSIDSVKVEKLVREFLTAQSLTILPQNSFGDAVSQFVDKDDKHAMEMFVFDSLENQVKYLAGVEHADEEELQAAIEENRSKLEELFAAGHPQKRRKAKRKPRPENWDSDLDGEWEAQPAAIIRSDDEDEEDEDVEPVSKAKGKAKTTAARKTAAPTRKTAAASKPRGKKILHEPDEEDDQDDAMNISDEEDPSLFIKQTKATAARKAPPAKGSASPIKRTTRGTPKTVARQSQLNFSQPSIAANGRSKAKAGVSEDEISDDDDAFEPPPSTARSTRSRR